METTISLPGVLLAAVSSFVVGGFWYSPSMFLKSWMKITGTTEADMQRNMVKNMATIGVMSLVMAYVLAHFMNYASNSTGTTGIELGLTTAFWLWLGFALTSIVTTGTMETRDRKVLIITSGNLLVTMLLMGLILGWFM